MIVRPPGAPVPPVTHVLYPLVVSERKVDREAWAREVATLIAEEAGGNKSAFARRVGVSSVKTIDRWLASSVNVSEESVRAVCRALNLPVAPMLVKIGYIRPNELPTAGPAHLLEADERAIAAIEAADLPPSLKRELVEHLRQQQAEHERQRLAEIERMIELARRPRGRAG